MGGVGGKHPGAPKPRASSSPQSQDPWLALAADSTAGAGGTEGLEGALPCHQLPRVPFLPHLQHGSDSRLEGCLKQNCLLLNYQHPWEGGHIGCGQKRAERRCPWAQTAEPGSGSPASSAVTAAILQPSPPHGQSRTRHKPARPSACTPGTPWHTLAGSSRPKASRASLAPSILPRAASPPPRLAGGSVALRGQQTHLWVASLSLPSRLGYEKEP